MRALILALALIVLGACHPPVLTTEPDLKAGGTIAGIVRATSGSARLATRKVTEIHVASGARFETTTGANGGYTIQVPAGMYRIELELMPGETITRQPSPTRIDVGDLDAQRDFVVGGR